MEVRWVVTVDKGVAMECDRGWVQVVVLNHKQLHRARL